MLFFELDYRKVDEQEDEQKDNGKGDTAAGDDNSKRCDQRSRIQGIAHVSVRTSGGEFFVLGEMTGGPSADDETQDGDGYSDGHAAGRRLREPGESEQKRKAGCDTQALYEIGVGLWKEVARCGFERFQNVRTAGTLWDSRVCMTARNTSGAVMARMLASICFRRS